jgi:uncharacterized protein YhaN
MVINLNRMQLAAIKRAAKNVQPLRSKKARLMQRVEALNKEIEGIDATIEAWENPVRAMTGGYSSEEILRENDTENTENNVEENIEENVETEVIE